MFFSPQLNGSLDAQSLKTPGLDDARYFMNAVGIKHLDMNANNRVHHHSLHSSALCSILIQAKEFMIQVNNLVFHLNTHRLSGFSVASAHTPPQKSRRYASQTIRPIHYTGHKNFCPSSDYCGCFLNRMPSPCIGNISHKNCTLWMCPKPQTLCTTTYRLPEKHPKMSHHHQLNVVVSQINYLIHNVGNLNIITYSPMWMCPNLFTLTLSPI